MRLHHQPLLLGLSALGDAAGPAADDSDYGPPTPTTFDWNSIVPASQLQYHDCYDVFKCARLSLPLDWQNSNDTRVVSIAMIKLPAKVPDDDASFGGSIFTNPGGPGGTGVGFVASSGRLLQDYVDIPGKKHYEIVSFDPRGIGSSRPLANCYPGNVLGRDALALETRGLGGAFRDKAAMGYVLALQDGYGNKCSSADESGLNGGAIFEYMGTASVARDMVEMVDKIDELRRREAGEKSAADEEEEEEEEEEREGLELRKREAGQVPRLQYMGFSYGTILGNYFASLFPERIGRIVLDGVCNADDFSNGPGWLTNTVDADKITDAFFEGCFTAGPAKCALARSGDASEADIRRRFWKWIGQLKETPLSGVSRSGNSIIISDGDILIIISMSYYKPLASFPMLAQLLDSAMRGENLEDLFFAIEMGQYGGPLQNACPLPNQTDDAPQPGADGRFGVVCGDGGDVTDKDASWWQTYQKQQLSQSSVFGFLWGSIRLPCSRWRFKANWGFRGPFTTPEPSQAGGGVEADEGAPAAPLLFLSNRLDPVTPLRAAKAMSKNHPGSRVVVQEAMGHCTWVAAYSKCVQDIVANYFDKGEVPRSEETACPVECGPWDEDCALDTLATMEPWYMRRAPLSI